MSSDAPMPDLVRALREGADRLEAQARLSDGRDLRPGERLVGELSTGLSNMVRVVVSSYERERHADSLSLAVSIQPFKRESRGWFRSGQTVVIRAHRLPAFARLLASALERIERETTDHTNATPGVPHHD